MRQEKGKVSKDKTLLESPSLQVKYTTLDHIDMSSWRKTLSIYEMHRANNIVNLNHREQYIKSKIYLRRLLSEKLDTSPHLIKLSYDQYGKPIVQNNPIKFSMSHSGEHLLVGISSNHIGVDVEEERNIDYNELIWEILEPDEIKEYLKLNSTQKKAIFYTGWTFKESLIKANGLHEQNHRFKLIEVKTFLKVNALPYKKGHYYTWRKEKIQLTGFTAQK